MTPRPLRAAAPRGPTLNALVPWLIGAIATGALYFGRSVLIPITLAILLSFLLAPIVAAFRRLRLTRTPSVLLAVLLALGSAAVTSTIIVSQAATLSKDAPAYAERIAEKVGNFRAEVRSRFGFLVRESDDGGSGHRNAERARRQGERALPPERPTGAVPVEVRKAPPTAMEEVETVLLPALAPVETALIVLIVTIFILFQKEDLRDRVIRLMGTADLHRTTVALDDGAKRLSRYFLSQFAVNCGFGAVIWGGLFVLGVPAPGLWGILAGLLRFVPYVGTVAAALGPLALAAAVDPGWGMVISVALLFLFVEPVIGYVIEPLLYGRSTGLSPVSVLIAALFWTWIWGAVGLVLSMPLTLMLVVLGRHIPAFEFFDILLGDRPALSPAETFYQRILAAHPDEAIDEAEDLLESMTLAQYYDEVMLAGLRLAAADVDRGAVERSAMHAVSDATIEVIRALADHPDPSPVEGTLSPAPPEPPHDTAPQPCEGLGGRSVICIPARGPLDKAVTAMVVQILRRDGCTVREMTRELLRDDAGVQLAGGGADTVCILGLFDERGFGRMQSLVRQIEQRLTGATVLIGVRRGPAEAIPAETPEGRMLLSSIADLCSAIRSAKEERAS